MEVTDWKAQVSLESREKIVIRITDELKNFIPSSTRETLSELKTLADNFENKIYAAATDENDYLKKISMKLLNLKEKSSQTIVSYSSQSKSSCSGETLESPSIYSTNVDESVSITLRKMESSHGIKSQGDKHQQSLTIHSNNHSQDHSFTDTRNNTATCGISATLQSEGPPLSSLTETPVPNILTEDSNLQNKSGISQDSVGYSTGCGMYSNVSPNNQMHVQERQQSLQVVNHQNSRQPQKLLHDSYPLQFKQECVPPSRLQIQSQEGQPQKQQLQNILQPNQVDSIKLSGMQTSLTLPLETQSFAVSDHALYQQSSCQHAFQPVLMRHSQTVLRKPHQTQQALVPSNQQPQLLSKNTAATSITSNQLIAQQNDAPDSPQQQERLKCLQNKTKNLQQEHSQARQNTLSSADQQQLARQSNSSGLQQQPQPLREQLGNPIMCQIRVAMEGQNLKTVSVLLPTQGQQSEPQLPERQLISQSQPEKMQQVPNPLQQDVRENTQRSGALNPTSQKWSANVGDWQEEVYQKVENLKSKYLKQLNEWRQALTKRLRKDDSVPQKPNTGRNEKFLLGLNQIIACLNVPKSKITRAHAVQLDTIEKKIIWMIYSIRKKSASSTGQGKLYPDVYSGQQMHSQTQTSQVCHLEDQKTPQLQSNKLQSSPTLKENNLTLSQQVSTLSGKMMHSREHLKISEKKDSMLQVAKGSLERPVSIPLVKLNNFLLRSQVNGLQSKVTPLETISDLNELKVRLGASAKKPLHQENKVNNWRERRCVGVKPAHILQCQSGDLHSAYNPHYSNSGASVPISSPEVSCLPLARHSPEIDVQNLPKPLTEARTHSHTANSCSAMLSSSFTQSSMPGNDEELTSDALSLSEGGNMPYQRRQGSLGPGTALVICSPGMLASTLLESSNLDDTNWKVSTIISDESSLAEQSLQRLVNVVNRISSEAFSAAVIDIGSVISITDSISNSPLANGSRPAIGEDFTSMTKYSLQERYLTRWNATLGSRKRKYLANAMPLHPSPISLSIDDAFRQLIDMEKPKLESSAISSSKRSRIEARHALLEEIREINQQLIDTVVVISDEDTIPTAAATYAGQGIIVKCSFSGVTVSPNFKLQQVSAQLSPIQPLSLLVPANYPNTSPSLLDKIPVEFREDHHQDLSAKVKSKLNASLRTLLEPLSLGEIARMWEFCARAVICESAQKHGGGTFSSNYGTWENCLGAA